MVIGILCFIAAAVFFFYNENIQQHAEVESKQVVAEIQRYQESAAPAITNQEVHPDAVQTMSVVTIDDLDYIGTLSIPDIKVEIPVMAEWSTSNARTAACRYMGSVETDDMIIAGHNYWSIFGNLHRLKTGSKVTFTDVNGQEFVYELTQTEIIDGNDGAGMAAGEWNLTLFTCTDNSISRVTLRFNKI